MFGALSCGRPGHSATPYPDPAPYLDAALADATRLSRLVEAVRSLPEKLKAVASLYLEDMPIKGHRACAGNQRKQRLCTPSPRQIRY